jgi:hypothetical protein
MVSFRSTIKALSSVLALGVYHPPTFDLPQTIKEQDNLYIHFFQINIATVSNAQISTFINRSAAGYSASFNIPASGNDTFIQLNGPASAGWVGTGIGTGMKGALMFVIYSDGNGGVTASARLGLYGLNSLFFDGGGKRNDVDLIW